MASGVLSGALSSPAALASDWPQWLGPDRTGVSKETGLLKSWPEGGPTLLWKAAGLGEAHATPSVAAGKVYGMGLRSGDEVIWCLDDKTGKELWATKIADGSRLVAVRADTAHGPPRRLREIGSMLSGLAASWPASIRITGRRSGRRASRRISAEQVPTGDTANPSDRWEQCYRGARCKGRIHCRLQQSDGRCGLEMRGPPRATRRTTPRPSSRM